MWLGGFKGDSYDRAEFRAWLRRQQKPTFMDSVTIHNTGAPYTLASVGGAKRMGNLANYYKNQKRWKGGPHFFIMEGRIYPGTPVHLPSVHSPSWNRTSIAFEVEGDFDGTHSPFIGKGIVAWETLSWAVAEFMEWIGWVPDEKHVKLHREDKATTHACPGKLITKPWLLKQMDLAMRPADAPRAVPVPVPAPVVPAPAAPAPAPQPAGTGGVVQRPGHFVYSNEWAVPAMKKVEGKKLVAYRDAPGWSIGYGHNSTSRVPPIPYEGMKITDGEAEAILRVDLKEHCRYLNTWIKVPLTQAMVDALCVFIHQMGPTQFRNRLVAYINAKMHWTTARTIELMPHAKAGVVRRRKFEAQRYRGGTSLDW